MRHVLLTGLISLGCIATSALARDWKEVTEEFDRSRFSRVYYDPVSVRFDPKNNIDSIRVRLITNPDALEGMNAYLQSKDKCRKRLQQSGPVVASEVLYEFSGRGMNRPREILMVNEKGITVCTGSEIGETGAEWEGTDLNSPQYVIYRDVILSRDEEK